MDRAHIKYLRHRSIIFVYIAAEISAAQDLALNLTKWLAGLHQHFTPARQITYSHRWKLHYRKTLQRQGSVFKKFDFGQMYYRV